MIEITHVIADELGIHARPAGMLVKKCALFECSIKIGTPAKMVDAKRIIGVMGLALKHGDEMIMAFDGPDETAASEAVAAFLKENM